MGWKTRQRNTKRKKASHHENPCAYVPLGVLSLSSDGYNASACRERAEYTKGEGVKNYSSTAGWSLRFFFRRCCCLWSL